VVIAVRVCNPQPDQQLKSKVAFEQNSTNRRLIKEQLLVEKDSDRSGSASYMRISITDRCNQRCFYCMPHGDVRLFRHSEILSYEEILAIVAAAVKTGFRKFRITGGEPLARKGICDLIRKMVAVAGVEEVVLTTNGVLLEDLAPALYAAGLRRVNISLDTLNPLKFQKITKRNHFQRVLRGIEAARRVGLNPIKINVVVIGGVNDDELEDFSRWAIREALAVRFIEYMPIGNRHLWETGKFVSIDDIRRRLEEVMDLHPMNSRASDGPARRYRLGATQGEIGLIGAVSHHFCDTCNRLRLTPEGKLRPCLIRDEEIDIRNPLRAGCEEAKLIGLIQTAVEAKINGHTPGLLSDPRVERCMSSIGG
jgi:cyclic pyranopterin phosphate synthase